ncbi:putative signaling protein [Caenibius tardaugens NBRC 16725]|uniref:diguanylate cyclase n=1 Tax=Caenibius tardaugens NBRC 16725 TaxID=1219035 RepID=U2YPZ4_9SPHN|nr:diguanylate cyclase [Caenibius tardaugens]GAD51015.1 putative signaling protein [Caenibius tardaugens NBRC 16725]
MDIDYFKQFNDCYGHIAGDECLVRVADVLQNVACDSKDVIARFGGEEFAILLPDADETSVLEIAEHCRQSIAAMQIPHERSGCSDVVTISAGVQLAAPILGSSPKSFCLSVDKLLYSAKNKGRNRVAVSERFNPLQP